MRTWSSCGRVGCDGIHYETIYVGECPRHPIRFPDGSGGWMFPRIWPTVFKWWNEVITPLVPFAGFVAKGRLCSKPLVWQEKDVILEIPLAEWTWIFGKPISLVLRYIVAKGRPHNSSSSLQGSCDGLPWTVLERALLHDWSFPYQMSLFKSAMSLMQCSWVCVHSLAYFFVQHTQTCINCHRHLSYVCYSVMPEQCTTDSDWFLAKLAFKPF